MFDLWNVVFSVHEHHDMSSHSFVKATVRKIIKNKFLKEKKKQTQIWKCIISIKKITNKCLDVNSGQHKGVHNLDYGFCRKESCALNWISTFLQKVIRSTHLLLEYYFPRESSAQYSVLRHRLCLLYIYSYWNLQFLSSIIYQIYWHSPSSIGSHRRFWLFWFGSFGLHALKDF